MKIKKIFITGFGTIKNQTYEFTSLNQIIRQNGSGKTTLCAFIECAFYGIDLTTKQYRKYLPWDNSAFGGYVVFEANGKTYRIQRTFGAKKSEDTFLLLDEQTLRQSLDFTENIGEELFGVDRKTFFSSCIFSLDTDFAFNNTAVYSKLNSIITNSDELDGFDKKTSLLEKNLKEYENAQRKGYIPTVRLKLEEVKDKITTLTPSREKRANYTEQVKQIKQRIYLLEGQISEQEKIIETKLLQSNALSLEAQLSFFSSEQDKLKASLKAEQEKLLGQNLTQEELDDILNKHEQLQLLIKEANNLQNEINFLADAIRDDFNYEKLQLAKQDYEQLSQLKIRRQTKVRQNTVNKFLAFSMLFFALALLGLGIYLFAKNLPAFFILTAISIAFTIWGVLSIIKSPLKQLDQDIYLLKSKLQDFLNACGYSSYEIETALPLIISEYSFSYSSSQQANAYKNSLNNKKRQISSIKEYIGGFLAKFNLGNNFSEDIKLLNLTLKNIRFLTERIASLEEKKSAYSNHRGEDLTLAKQRELKKQLITEKSKLDETLNLVNINLNTEKINLAMLEEKQKEFLELSTQLEKLLQEQDTIKKTLDCLLEAKENLISGCLTPLNLSLNQYAKTLLPKYQNFTVDKNFFITFTYNGFIRNFNDLSLGEKQLVFLCLRIGLILATFKKQTPFIILDDVLAPLDEDNLILSKEFLRQISSTIQIIHLAPLQDRKI